MHVEHTSEPLGDSEGNVARSHHATHAPLSPDAAARDRQNIARIAAHTGWARTVDRTARTEPGRAGLRARFLREVDPDGVLSEVERERRAESARRAFYLGLARKSAAARRRNAADAAELRAMRSGGAA